MSAQPERLLILAEGFSGDPHYGEAARSVPRVRGAAGGRTARLGAGGEVQNGIPIVGTVGDALCFSPTTALVGVAHQGGRFPGVARAPAHSVPGPARRERPA